MMVKKRITSVDVAREASVSQSTVSRVLSGNGRFTPQTKERVLSAAYKLGYKPNALARSLTTQRSNLVGIVMADITNPFYPNVLEKFTLRFQELDKQVLLFHVPPNGDVDDILPRALQYQMEAMIIASATISSEIANECARQGMTVILFNRYALDSAVSAVSCDNLRGGEMVADYLLNLGKQRLAFIAGNENTSTNIDREKGFRNRLQAHGITQYQREPGTYSFQSGFDAAIRLLNQDNPPDAIFCANDIIAMGCMDAARFELGMRIPDELCVVGFDDIPACRRPSYALTTIRQPVSKMIDTTIALLNERTKAPGMPPVLRLEPGRLIERASTRQLEQEVG